MNEQEEILNDKLPKLRIAVILMLVISVIYQPIISYFNQEKNFLLFLKDLGITIITEVLFCYVVYFLIFLFQRLFGKSRWNWLQYPLGFASVLLVCFYLLYFSLMLQNYVWHPLSDLLPRRAFRMHMSINLVAVVFIYSILLILNSYQLALDRSAVAEKLQREYTQIRLTALKSQVNPHFLFNSLSVLSSLVRTAPETSENFIVQMAKSYRYILDQKNADLVTLKEELDFLDAYFYLLKIRFGDKLSLNLNINIPKAEWLLPPLTLQMLIENAVKHNTMSSISPLHIDINSFADSLQIVNNMSPRTDNPSSTGFGLENIRKRISYLTDKKVTILNTGQSFSVNIPLIKNKTGINESSNH